MSPVDEVALFLHKEKVRNDAALRQNAMLHSITLRYATHVTQLPNAVKPPKVLCKKKRKIPPIIDISDSPQEGATPYPASAAASAVAGSSGVGGVKPPPTTEQLQVPKTIRVEWARVERLWYDGETDAPCCTAPNCPYSSGGPLQIRYNLIERLVELEHHLWGR